MMRTVLDFFSLVCNSVQSDFSLQGEKKRQCFRRLKDFIRLQKVIYLCTLSVFKYSYQKYRSFKTLMKLITTMNYYYCMRHIARTKLFR